MSGSRWRLNSRITDKIREAKGHTDRPNSALSRGRLGGSISASADVRNEVTAATGNDVVYEVDRLGTTEVGADDTAHCALALSTPA